MSGKKIGRRRFFRQSGTFSLGFGFAAGGLFQAGCGLSLKGPSKGRPPNFVILFADDMGYSDWDFGGDPTIRTPNLVKMASQGVRFTQFYAGASVCSPSRAALLTPFFRTISIISSAVKTTALPAFIFSLISAIVLATCICPLLMGLHKIIADIPTDYNRTEC